MANRNWASGGKMYSMHVKPIMIDCNFKVSLADSAGKGITNLKGPGVASVFMNTSATPAAGSPNPAPGYILVRLQDNYARHFLQGSGMIGAELSGTNLKIDNAALTAGVAYTITVLGDATAAKWQSIGVPKGVTPAVGVSFIALNTGTGSNVLTSRVQAPATAADVASIEIVGVSDLSINPNPAAAQGYGAQIILVCRDFAGAITAPADGQLVSLSFMMSDSSVTVQGE